MPFIIRPSGDADLSGASIHSETAMPQNITGLSAGSYQVGRVTWADDFVDVTADTASAGDPVLAIFAGQSNATAAGTEGETPPARYAALANVSILPSATGAWEAYQPGTNATPNDPGTGRWGPEAEFAYQFTQAFPGRALYMVKVTEGGSSVEQVGSNDWAPGSTNEMFEALEANVAQAKTLLQNETITTVSIWNQGEADSKSAVKIAAYVGTDGTDGTWGAFYAAYRTRIDAGPFINARIRPYTGNDSVSWAFALREVSEQYSDVDATFSLIDADFEGNFAALHPPVSWVDGLGARAFARYNGTYGASYPELDDTTPDAFAFADVTTADTDTVYTQATNGPLTGFNRSSAISVTGGEYRILNDLDATVYADWTTSAGIIHPYQSIELRLTSATAADSAATMTVTVGATSASWSVTTQASSGGGGGATYPANIADIGNGAWYDMQATPAAFTETGGEVTQIDDLTGNARHLTLATASSDPSLDTLAGHTSVNLLNDIFTGAGLETVFGGPAWSFTYYGSADATRTAFALSLENAGDNLTLGHRSIGTYQVTGSLSSNTNLATATGAPESLTWNFDGTTLTLYRDGVATAPTLTAPFGGQSWTGAFIGGQSDDKFRIRLNFGEVIAVPRALTAQEISDLHGYLSGRWT